MKEVKIAILGLGNMGSAHVRNVQKIANCKLTAVCDWKEEKRKNKDLPKTAKVFSDDDEFFAKGDFDAVIIAVPHYQHVPLTLRALAEGKHVLLEKPVAVQKSEGLKLIDAAKKYPKLKLAAMFNQRTRPAHKKIKSIIDSGELGKIKRVNWIITDWYRTQYYYDSGDWRASWRGEGGGVLLNQCPHQLDLMQWFFGMPSKVTSVISLGKYHDIEVEDDVTAVLEYPNGATGVFITSTGEAPGTNRLEITGDRGRLVFEDGKLAYLRNEMLTSEHIKESKQSFAPPEKWIVDIPVGEVENQHQLVIDAFVKSILDGTALVAEAVEGINGLELGNAILYSGMTKKPVKLPIDTEKFDKMLTDLIAKSRYQKHVVENVTSTDEMSSSY